MWGKLSSSFDEILPLAGKGEIRQQQQILPGGSGIGLKTQQPLDAKPRFGDKFRLQVDSCPLVCALAEPVLEGELFVSFHPPASDITACPQAAPPGVKSLHLIKSSAV